MRKKCRSESQSYTSLEDCHKTNAHDNNGELPGPRTQQDLLHTSQMTHMTPVWKATGIKDFSSTILVDQEPPIVLALCGQKENRMCSSLLNNYNGILMFIIFFGNNFVKNVCLHRVIVVITYNLNVQEKHFCIFQTPTSTVNKEKEDF